MTTETNNAMTINMDDANLPTEGPAWEAMLEHVLANASSEVLYADVDPEWVQSNYSVGDIYDDEEIIEAAGELQYDTINDYIWGRVKDICREENLPYPEFCAVSIHNELMTAIQLKAKVAALTADHQTLKLQTNEQADIISRQNEEIAKLKSGKN